MGKSRSTKIKNTRSLSRFDRALNKIRSGVVPRSVEDLDLARDEFSRYLMVDMNRKRFKSVLLNNLKELSESEVIDLFKEGSDIPEVNTTIKDVVKRYIIDYFKGVGSILTFEDDLHLSFEDLLTLIREDDGFGKTIDSLLARSIFKMDDKSFVRYYSRLCEFSEQFGMDRMGLAILVRSINIGFYQALTSSRSVYSVWDELGFDPQALKVFEENVGELRSFVSPVELKEIIEDYDVGFDISYSPSNKNRERILQDVSHYPKSLILMYIYGTEKVIHELKTVLSVDEYLDLFRLALDLPDNSDLYKEYEELRVFPPTLDWSQVHLGALQSYLRKGVGYRSIKGLRVAIFVPLIYARRLRSKRKRLTTTISDLPE